MLECLNPSPPRAPRRGVDTRHAASRLEPSPGERDGVTEEPKETGVRHGGDGGRDGRRGHAIDEEDQKPRRRDGQREGVPVTHTCWVKSGHDLLHERGPFMRSLLHKVGGRDASVACYASNGPPREVVDRLARTTTLRFHATL